jgi:hypothetical protein
MCCVFSNLRLTVQLKGKGKGDINAEISKEGNKGRMTKMRSQEDKNEENERKEGKMKNGVKGCKERVKLNNGKRRRIDGNKKQHKEREE